LEKDLFHYEIVNYIIHLKSTENNKELFTIEELVLIEDESKPVNDQTDKDLLYSLE
jgi:hypothetical protein